MSRKATGTAVGLLLAAIWAIAGVGPSALQTEERVGPIAVPVHPLPSEEASKGVTRFSFIAYGDTRGSRDGTALQAEHTLGIDAMIASIRQLAPTPSPIRFILQSGDAVTNGAVARQWNTSFTPLIDRLTSEGGAPYYLVPGNHDVSGAATVDVPGRQPGLRNYLDAMSNLLPPDGSPRRLAGYPTFGFGYGNTFVLGFDANVAGDEKQFQWITHQLEGLDRVRYPNIIVFTHQAPFSSGPHGGPNVEPATAALRTLYLPLFQAHHVRAVISGHEHFFEHWVEHYKDGGKPYRMDLIVTGGGGAPIYTYTGEPDTKEFLRANQSSQVTLEHLVRPGKDASENPYHFVMFHVDGERLDLEVIAIDPTGTGFMPYRSNKTTLSDER